MSDEKIVESVKALSTEVREKRDLSKNADEKRYYRNISRMLDQLAEVAKPKIPSGGEVAMI